MSLTATQARADWVQVSGTLANIDVGSAQNVVGTQSNGSMWKWSGSDWTQLRCCVTQSDVGSDGTIWAVNPPDNDRVLTWGGSSWVVIPGQLVQISVGSAQHIWGVNRAGQVWRWTGSDWALLPGTLRSVSVAADGTAWGVSPDSAVWRWSGGNWVRMPGTLQMLSVGSVNTIWGVQANGMVWKWNGTDWTRIDGTLKSLGVGADGTVWGVQESGQVWRWNDAANGSPVASTDTDWSASFNVAGWSSCPANQMMSGLFTSGNADLSQIEMARCSASTVPGSAVDGNWWASFDRAGTSLCPQDYFVAGFYRSACGSLNCLEAPRCIRYQNKGWQNCRPVPVGVGAAPQWNVCPAGTQVAGITRSDAQTLAGITAFQCCEMGDVASATPPPPVTSDPVPVPTPTPTTDVWNEGAVAWGTGGYTWQACPANTVMTGLLTSSNTDLTRIAGATCASNGQSLGAALQGNWSVSFDMAGKSRCPQNTFMTGVYRSACNQLYCLEYARCAPLQGRTWGECAEVSWTIGASSQQNQCPAGSVLAGLTRSADHSLAGITGAYCCKPGW